MDFFYRVFVTNDTLIWADQIESFIANSEIGLTPYGVVDEEDENNLDAPPVEIVFLDHQGRQVASLVYEKLEDSDVLKDEIDALRTISEEMLPARNRDWLCKKLDQSVGCYCFSVSEVGFEDQNWEALSTLAGWLRDETFGFEQCDSGQITNERGQIVLLAPDDDSEISDGDESDVVAFEAALRENDLWRSFIVDSDVKLRDFLNANS